MGKIFSCHAHNVKKNIPACFGKYFAMPLIVKKHFSNFKYLNIYIFLAILRKYFFPCPIDYYYYKDIQFIIKAFLLGAGIH